MLPGTCLCLTKSALKSINAFGGHGIYPWLNLLPGGQRFRVGGADVPDDEARDDGGKSTAWVTPSSESESSRSSSGSLKVIGVTLGAKVTGR